MITNRVIQAWINKANANGSDLMRWSDFIECFTELKNTDTTSYTENPAVLSGIPTYADDDAAGTGGVPEGGIYQDTTGVLRIKQPET